MPGTTDRRRPRVSGKPGKPGTRRDSRVSRRFKQEIRRATPGDLPAIRVLEHAAFQPYRQASDRSLRRSLAQSGKRSGRRQSVWVIDGQDGRLDALLVLWHHPHRLRVYDVASHPDSQGQGLGFALMQHAEALARKGGCTWVSLEADPKEAGLVSWYERQGYAIVGKPLPHYYHNGNAAVRMTKRIA